ncbi:hypothetical protein MMC18_003933 [Xylographa bjoerkii]|nr:hypothetical protein [Xylographa bjoerkii]
MSNYISYPHAFELVCDIPIDDVALLGAAVAAFAAYLLKGTLWNKPDPYQSTWFERPQEQDSARNLKKETRDISQKLEEANKDIVVFFGSQSGTAEGFANRLARELQLRSGANTLAADLSDYEADSIARVPSTKLVVFILSTFGEGDPSDNTADLWEWLTKSTSVNLMNLRYAAFGLGNQNYKYYNRVVDVVTEALSTAGAIAFLPTGRADDSNGGTEEDFMEWRDSLCQVLQKDLGYEQRESAYEPTISVIEDDSLTPIDLHLGEPIEARRSPSKPSLLEPSVAALPLVKAEELFATSSNRNCLHMEFDLSGFPEVKYKTGDHMAIYPSNPEEEVSRLLEMLGLEDRKEIPLSISALDPAAKFSVPTPTTLQALFQHYLEICAPVSRDTVNSLCQFAPSAKAKNFLHRLGSSKEAYSDHILRNHVTMGRLLEQAAQGNNNWKALPVTFLVEIIPPLRPRYYSISSSSVVQARQASITAIVNSRQIHTTSPERILGLTSNYLLALKHAVKEEDNVKSDSNGPTYMLEGPNHALEGSKVFAQIRRSKFKLPLIASHPIVMIAAGTGIAPFRGFLQERARLQSMGRDVGKMMLFFGCRRSEEDYLYRKELDEMNRSFNGKLEIVTAFSREQESKIYVQDRVEEHAQKVVEMLQTDAILYICGAAAMAREVSKKVGEAMKHSNRWDDGQLKAWCERAKRIKRWQEDVWG